MHADPRDCLEMEELRSVLIELRKEVACLLGVPPKPLRVTVSRAAAFAYTDYRGEIGKITLPRWGLKRSTLAHEIAHCLVKTDDLVIAEGIATFAGCQLGGHCRDFFFLERAPTDVVKNFWDKGPDATALLAGDPRLVDYLRGDGFHLLRCRLTFMFAASFYQFAAAAEPTFALSVRNGSFSSFSEYLAQINLSPGQFSRRWHEWLWTYGG